MKFLGMRKVRNGKYLKGYELDYLNKAGTEKTYEMVSFAELQNADEIGQKVNGLSIVAFGEEKMLLLKEFRMGVNRCIYNLCAGMLEAGETIEECIARELYEETGLKLERIIKILPPSFAAVSISDAKNQIAFVQEEQEEAARKWQEELIVMEKEFKEKELNQYAESLNKLKDFKENADKKFDEINKVDIETKGESQKEIVAITARLDVLEKELVEQTKICDEKALEMNLQLREASLNLDKKIAEVRGSKKLKLSKMNMGGMGTAMMKKIMKETPMITGISWRSLLIT